MKITNIESKPLIVPNKKPFKISRGEEMLQSGIIIVKIYTDENIVGYGETEDLTAYSGLTVEGIHFVIKKYLINALIGEDPFDIEHIFEKMEKAIPYNEYAKAAIDFALYDIMGKAVGLPVYKLIGGNYRKKIPVVGALVDIVSPHEAAQSAITQINQLGVKNVKIKIGDPYSIKRVQAVREAVGPNIKIRVDANAGYNSTLQAIKVIKEMEPYNLEIVEQPLPKWNLRGMAEVRRNVEVPILADESVDTIQDALNVIRMEAADIILIKIVKHGGLYNSKKIAAIAEAAGIPCLMGGAYGISFACAANLHFATATMQAHKSEYACEVPYTPLIGIKYINLLKKNLIENTYKEGYVVAPEGPGLGVEANEEEISKYLIKI